ncbi:30S ribosomal protein S15, partial [Wolbachia endosymbiont of Pentidionis agamae]
HKKDHHSRYGLFRLISKRRRLLNYIKSKFGYEVYQKFIEKLGIRK